MFPATLLPAALAAALSLSAVSPAAAAPERADSRQFLEQFLRMRQGLAPAAAVVPPALPASVSPVPPIVGAWAPGFQLPGLDDAALCVEFYRGQLVAGGSFRYVDGFPIRGIARWDGTRWQGLGDGLIDVRHLVTWNDKLVAAGGFFSSGPINTGPIAVWDGTSWSGIEPELHGWVSALAADDTSLVVAGQLYFGSDSVQYQLAQWNGSRWVHRQSDIVGTIYALAPYQGHWFLGGSFQPTPTDSMPALARWDGDSWTPVPGALSLDGYHPLVTALATFHDELIVGGAFSQAGDVTVWGIARWTHSGWQSIPGINEDGFVSALAADDQVLHIGKLVFDGGLGAYSGLARWDGTTFAAESPGPDQLPFDIAAAPGKLALAGYFSTLGERAMPFVALRSNGAWSSPAYWRPNTRGLRGTVHDIVGYRGGVAAAGDLQVAADDTGWVAVSGVATFSGGHWRSTRPLTYGFGDGHLFADHDTLYMANGATYRLDEGGWTLVGNSWSYQILHMASAFGTLWGGGIKVGGPSYPSAFYRLISNTWVPIAPPAGVPADTANVTGMTVLGNQLVVAWTWFDSGAGESVTALHPYDGAHWGAPLGLFAGGDVLAMDVSRGRLAVGGTFASVDGASLPGFALQGPSGGWSGAGFPLGYVTGVTVSDSMLIAGNGSLVYAYDGSAWRPLADCYVMGAEYVMRAVGRSLWVGGILQQVSTIPVGGVARYDLPIVIPPPLSPPPAAWFALGQNPSHETTELPFSVRQPGRLRIALHDVSGRVVRVLVDRSTPAGDFQLIWDGRDDDGRALPSGLYFARLQLDGVSLSTRKLVRAR